MYLTFEQITDITQGAVNVTCDNGMYYFYRMREGEFNPPDKSIADATAGIILEFKTDAVSMNLKVYTKISMSIRKFFAFDIFKDGKLIGHIKNYDDNECVGNYSQKEFELGSFSGEFSLGDGDKTVKIVMPYTLIAAIEKLELADATYINPVKKPKTLIAYGDSITQGYDAQHPFKTYACQLAEHLDAELFNKAIGGAVFEHWLVDASCHERADYVTVAYGTNDWTVFDADEFRKHVADFMKSIVTKYPDAVKFVITPIWRSAADTVKNGMTFYDIEKIITEECLKYSDIRVISGLDLIPHDKAVFGDLCLHPNDEGFEHYSKNLCDIIDNMI